MVAVNRDGVLFRIEGLRKDYIMGEVTVSALRGVDLCIYRGEFLAIIGPSGSGKSTLLNIIGGMDTPSAGSVVFKDQDLSRYTPHELTLYRRHHIGFVFQFYNLISNLTARENVEMATEISKNPMDADRALELVGLRERRDHFPSQLSGGEQQRVAIARAVAKQPEILLCDEPTGALDYSTGKVVLAFLRDVNRRTAATVVIITHNAAVGGMADRVVHIRDGIASHIEVNETPLNTDQIEW